MIISLVMSDEQAARSLHTWYLAAMTRATVLVFVFEKFKKSEHIGA